VQLSVPPCPPNTGRKRPVLEARELSKSYGAVKALDAVSFRAVGGEVIAIVGDNGAGKSTLLKVLSGAITHDTGQLRVSGELADFRSPHDAERVGIEAVYQDLALVNTLDVGSNIFLGREIPRQGIAGRIGLIDRRAMRREGREALRDLLGVEFPTMRRTVEMLSGGQRQAVAIVRSASRLEQRGHGVILLDEPTAALGVAQRQRVGMLIKRLASKGHLVVIVSHDLPTVFELASRIFVMRLGRLVTELHANDSDLSTLVGLITGAIEPTDITKVAADDDATTSSDINRSSRGTT